MHGYPHNHSAFSESYYVPKRLIDAGDHVVATWSSARSARRAA